MEWEALLFGIEPIVALSVGVAAIVLAPLIGSLAQPEVEESLSNGGRELVKKGVKFGIETYDNLQTSMTQTAQSWSDLVAEAKAEAELSRNSFKNPRQVQIVPEE